MRQITDEAGLVILAEAYDPYGNPTVSVGTAQTNYGFTGEQTDPTGMVYLRARYYAPEMGRFMSRDTWGGDDTMPMSYNLWLYTSGNPVNRLDPSGQCWVTPPGSNNPNPIWFPDGTSQCPSTGFGFSLAGDWTDLQIRSAYAAVVSVGKQLSTSSDLAGLSAIDAFKRIYNKNNVELIISMTSNCAGCHEQWCELNHRYDNGPNGLGYRDETDHQLRHFCLRTAGFTKGPHLIQFAEGNSLNNDLEWNRNNIVHELGHSFDGLAGGLPRAGVQAANVSEAEAKRTYMRRFYCANWPVRGRPGYGPNYGFASASNVSRWQMHYTNVFAGETDYGEEFADMYLGWTFDTWEPYNAITHAGEIRSDWMKAHMPEFIQTVLGK